MDRAAQGTDSTAAGRNRVWGGTARRGHPATSSIFAAGLGVLCASLAAFALAEPPRTPPGEPRVWVADRDASRVYALDANLYVARSVTVDLPVDVEPAPDGGLWVLRAETPSSTSTHRLDRFDAAGVLETELWIERALDLAVLGDGDQALILEARAEQLPRLVRVRREGSVFPLYEVAGLTCVSGERASAIVGTSNGRVLRVDATTGFVQASADVGGSLVDLARGPTAGSLWALDGAGTGRVLLLASDLSVHWSVTLPRAATSLAPVPGEERVWLAAANEPCVVRYGPGGVVELDRCGLPLPGLGRSLAWRNGLLVAAVGAVLRLDAQGGLLPGQGGFEHVIDLAPVE